MAHEEQLDVKPTLAAVEELLSKSIPSKHPPNLIPIYTQIQADLLTPTLAYLRISKKYEHKVEPKKST